MDVSINKRKQIVYWGFLAIGLIAVIALIIPHAFAGWADFPKSFAQGIVNDMHAGLYQNVTDILLGESSNFYDVLVTNGPGKVVSNALKGLGMGVVMLFIYMNVIQEMQRGQDNMDMWLKIFIKMAVSVLVISYLDEIFDAINDIGLFIVEQVNLTASDPQNVPSVDDLIQGKKGVAQYIGLAVELLFPALCLKLSIVAVKLASYSLFIEFAVRRAFAPIAVADIAGEGMRSPGMRYFKRYLALYIRMAAMIVICAADATLLDTTMSLGGGAEGAKLAWDAVAVNYAAITLILKVNEIANDVVGA